MRGSASIKQVWDHCLEVALLLQASQNVSRIFASVMQHPGLAAEFTVLLMCRAC